jgi:RNA recognition motif. (a.k.a. RRM, RBD, or RNP domain)
VYSAGFFSQFGDVKNVRMSRSKKTAQSKGYAFLEFKHPEVLPLFSRVPLFIAASVSVSFTFQCPRVFCNHTEDTQWADAGAECQNVWMSQGADLFHNLQVAPIAAQAMDGYMMFAQKLKVHVMKRKDVHPELMKGGCCDNR